MTIQRIGTADNKEEWLEQRKDYLTASSIYAWRGEGCADPKNKWYFDDSNRQAIIAEKFHGYVKEFTPYAQVSMEHGSYDEENIIAKTGQLLGCVVEPDNSMFVNDRWPHLAATIDAFIYAPTIENRKAFCQDELQAEAVRQRLGDLPEGDATILEIKKSVSVGWARKQVPEYYIAQVQTQLTICNLDFGVISAECLCKHPKEKWRMFWDLRPTIIERDPHWETVLDQCNEEFARCKEENQ